MQDLNIISDGSVLIRGGVIEEVGTTRRIGNLAPARQAREIDAGGRVVMPAFVDPDAILAAPGPVRPGESAERDISRMSWRRLESRAEGTAADFARYGVLTAGAHTLAAPDLQNTVRALRLHHKLQSKPLRIRSVFSPQPHFRPDDLRQLACAWMPAIINRKLASLLEIPDAPAPTQSTLAQAAAAAGFHIRIRLPETCPANTCELAWAAGAISLVGGVPDVSSVTRSLALAGCVTVEAGTRILAGRAGSARRAIDEGTPLALGSGYRENVASSMNPQFLLYLAGHALGMTAEEAIVATTYNAACSLRFSHVTGSVAPGKSADLCLMDVDDYHELARRAGHHDVSLVMRAGKVVYRRAGVAPD
ncbi:MAG TPA: amidohydrolase family protein [Bryobacteraceae bacterium]|nr:amidohydrolase family protein [Bryobacteraceae bacterium]